MHCQQVLHAKHLLTSALVAMLLSPRRQGTSVGVPKTFSPLVWGPRAGIINNHESGWLRRFEMWELSFALKHISFGDLVFGRGHFKNSIRPFKMGPIFV